MTKKQLREHCDAEFENIYRVKSELTTVLQSRNSDYPIAELAAIATFIHNCYNGMENILKRILYFEKKELKDGPTWHKDLLKSASAAGLITDDLYAELSNYLSFRHFFVHAYSFTLRWVDLKPLAENLDSVLNTFTIAIHNHLEKQGLGAIPSKES